MSTPQTAAKPSAPTPPPSRMRLDKVVKGKLKQSYRVLAYGPEGVGKSTFGAGAPKPIFIGAEEGTAQLDVERFPTPGDWLDVLEAVRVLTHESHGYQTAVFDTLDWMEPLLWRYICERDKKSNIEDYGYGKGYVAALDEWRFYLAALERLRAVKGMHVVLLAHSWVKLFKNPVGDDYDRYGLKVNDRAGGVLKEWCDAVLFANFETYAKKDEKTKRVRGVATGARLIYTERSAAWDAKNRYSLPAEMALSWEDFAHWAEVGQTAKPEDLRAEILRKAQELGEDVLAKVKQTVEKAGDNAQSLALINNRVNARLAERAATAQTAPAQAAAPKES